MKCLGLIHTSLLLILTVSGFASVSVTAPVSGSVVGSPVKFVATASTSSCSKGVASMGVYVDNKLQYVVNGKSLDSSLTISAGDHSTVVEEWDFCGGATYTTVPITVSSSSSGVTVTSPAVNASVGSPVNYVATATASGCSLGVASMGVYVDNELMYVVNGKSLNTNVTISEGSHSTVVEEWDLCGGASYTTVPITVTSKSGVSVTSPANNASVSNPVNYKATATSTCTKGVASMGVYVNNVLMYVANGASLNTNLTLASGTNNTVVQEWDYCGGSVYQNVTVNVTATGTSFKNLQASKGWVGYGELPPKYDICTNCGPGITWSSKQGINSPSLSGNATKFTIGGTTDYADVLWTNPLIGDFSSQGLPDKDHKIIPTLHNFTYDIYFYGSSLGLSEVLEFDINQYLDGKGYTWGHQCRIAGGNEFDVWDNVKGKWVATGVSCKPIDNSWNHLTLQVQRTSDNQLLYHSITLNGVTTTIDRTYAPFSVGNWYGVTANFQLDGNYKQSPYSVYADQFTFTYW